MQEVVEFDKYDEIIGRSPVTELDDAIENIDLCKKATAEKLKRGRKSKKSLPVKKSFIYYKGQKLEVQ